MTTTAIVVDNTSVAAIGTRIGVVLSTGVGPIEESGPSVGPIEESGPSVGPIKVFGGRMFPVEVSGVGPVGVYGGVGFIVVTRGPFFNSTWDKYLCIAH